MAKYLLRGTLNHCGRYVDDKLTSKFSMKIEVDDETIKSGKSIIGLNNYSAEFDSPCSELCIFAKLIDYTWDDSNKYTNSSIEISDGTCEGRDFIDICVLGEEPDLEISFPELILE